jgi:hypothetical protein
MSQFVKTFAKTHMRAWALGDVSPDRQRVSAVPKGSLPKGAFVIFRPIPRRDSHRLPGAFTGLWLMAYGLRSIAVAETRQAVPGFLEHLRIVPTRARRFANSLRRQDAIARQ